MKKAARVIVWALDPFQKSLSAHQAAITTLNRLATPFTEVQPIFVWNGGLPNGVTMGRGMRKKLAIRGDEILRRLVGARLKPTLKNLLVLEYAVPGAAEQAVHAAECAQRLRAQAIVVSQAQTHGLTKWMLGSFAENLLELSQIPVILAPLQVKAKPSSRGILVATDFSDAADEALERVAEVASATKKPVTLFHRVDFFPSFGTAFAFEAGIPVSEAEADLVEWSKKELEIRASRLRLRGISVTTKLETYRKGNAADRILKEAAKGYDALAVAAHRGKVARLLLGSTTRRLVRLAKLPLWVHKPSVSLTKKGRTTRSRVTSKAPEYHGEPTYLV